MPGTNLSVLITPKGTTTPVVLGTTNPPATPIYTAPTNTRALIKKVTATNTGATAAAVTVFKTSSGVTPATANIIIPARVVAPAGVAGNPMESFELENHVMLPGESIYAFSDTASAVNFLISGIENY